ncbi:MAG TPA: DUF1572 family protein [Longimicrobiaceae bacterium]|nr:DUF1572 family protein [Longimicrobiaceae bacterium]
MGTLYLESARATFRKYRTLAEGAMEQVDDAAFFAAPQGEEPNSIAIVVKHVAGNLRSRWTDFLTTDGEKPDRDRDGEFERRDGDTRASLMARWNGAWEIALRELDALAPADLARTVTIRAEPHSVVLAIDRQLTHAAYHVGQIVLLAKQLAPRWTSLSIPRGQSQQFTAAMQAQANGAPSR